MTQLLFVQEVEKFRGWLDSLTQFRTKVVIAGNHDLPFDTDFYERKWSRKLKEYEDPTTTCGLLDSDEARSNGIVFAADRFVEVDGWTMYGCSWVPDFGAILRWLGVLEYAFMIPRGDSLLAKYAPLVSPNLQSDPAVIPTSAGAGNQSPPVDILLTHGPPHSILDQTVTGSSVGCEELAKIVKRVKPRVHCEAYGTLEKEGTLYVNSANVNLKYQSVNPPVVVDLGPR
ncbi:metallophosphoesterase domain-containing protein 1 [Gonapodya sp. JEL0774]|nr:metallophosphoesterase domain-containing protein 1 [Gonapodya sp. JEL0774]